jgi:hypothetical protein
MRKSYINYWRLKIGQLNYWYVFTVFVLSTAVAIYALRQNNLTMIRLREAVYVADKNNVDVETPLRALRQHIYSHMNSDPSSGANAIKPPIQLKYRYERLVAAEKQRITTVNAQVYTDAQNYCETQNSAFSGRSRVPCIQDYVAKNGVQEKPIDDSLYKFDFVSPRLSLDVAGISLLISLSSLLLFIFLFAVDRLARWELDNHQ